MFESSQSNLITEKGESLKLDQLKRGIRQDFSFLNERDLVLIKFFSLAEFIALYTYCLESKIIAILVPPTIENSLLDDVINIYKPDYIFDKSIVDCDFEFYIYKSFFSNVFCFERNPKCNRRTHKSLAILLSTSGSTGSSKLVGLSYENLFYNSKSIIEYLNINSDDVAITSLPLSYSYGLSVINTHLMKGGDIICTNASILDEKFWNLFSHFKATSFSGVPFTYELADRLNLFKERFPHLKTLTQAGGKLSVELIEKFNRISDKNNYKFFVMYGQTEGTARLSFLDPRYLPEKAGSIGKPIPGGDFELIDNRGLPISEPFINGELVYYGKNVMLGYAQTLDELRISNALDGRLETGDIAYFDNEGFFYITGRKKRFIKIAGNRISLDSIEARFKEKDIDSVTIGFDDNLHIFFTDTEDLPRITNLLKKDYKILPRYYKIQKIDSIPRLANQKVDYQLLTKKFLK